MRYFTDAEFLCKCGRAVCDAPKVIDEHLEERLDALRMAFGGPLTVNSGLRCRYHNDAVGGAPDSAHLTGQACDLACADAAMRRVLTPLALAFFDYVELAPHHVHVDTKPREAARLLAVGNG